MDSTTPPDIDAETVSEGSADFDQAVARLMRGLGELHTSTGSKIHFAGVAAAVRDRLDDGEQAADLVDQYVNNVVESGKFGHFINSALAFSIQSARLNDSGSGSAWLHLCQAYFIGGMATLQFNLTRGAHLRVQPYHALKDFMVQLVADRCPPEKWASLEEMWRAIDDTVTIENERLNGKPGFSKDPKAAFLRLAKDRRDFFELHLSSPVKRGRPAKKCSGT